MARVVIITGGTGGLGKAVTKQFLAHDYQVLVTYRDDEELKDLLESVSEAKSRLEARRIDVTDEASLDELAAYVSKKYERLHALVTLVGGFKPGTLGENTNETFNALFSLNTKSFLLTCNALVPLMKPTKKDREAANIVAVAAKPALEPVNGLGLYAASKAAVVSLVRTLAKELLDENVSVNAIAPSTIDTLANRKAMPKADWHSWVKPSEIAEAIYFLANQSQLVTSGTILPVYGKA